MRGEGEEEEGEWGKGGGKVMGRGIVHRLEWNRIAIGYTVG